MPRTRSSGSGRSRFSETGFPRTITIMDRITNTACLAALDHAHVWHPFTPMRQWREQPPLIIASGDGSYLIDTNGKYYIDGVSSLWCNVHGHRVTEIDDAVRNQLAQIAHTTMLGLSSPPAIELAARLVELTDRHLPVEDESMRSYRRLNKVFYSDAGATAVEVAFKMAVGYWHHTGKPEKNRFIGLAGAYHGDTTGSMSVGFSPLFHQPFVSMVFEVDAFPCPDPVRPPQGVIASATMNHWPNENTELQRALLDHCIGTLRNMLEVQADRTAAVVIEPVMQGAAGMICQPPGFVAEVRELCDRYDVLLVADEVATGFGRTGMMFACEHDGVTPDLLCLAKGITAGYLPLAVTMATDRIAEAFEGDQDTFRERTLYHGHTYTGNPLACAAALASLDLFDKPGPEGQSDKDPNQTPNLLAHIQESAALIAEKLDPLRTHPHILDIRQRGLMVGIELGLREDAPDSFDFAKQTARAFCHTLRDQGLIIRPLGDVIVLMPIPAMPHDVLSEMLDLVVHGLHTWDFAALPPTC